MIAAAGLFAFAGLLMAVAAPMLARASWPDRAPRLTVAAWFAMTALAVASVIMGGLALLVPTVRVSPDLGRLLEACVMALRARYAHPGGAALAGAGAAARHGCPGGRAGRSRSIAVFVAECCRGGAAGPAHRG